MSIRGQCIFFLDTQQCRFLLIEHVANACFFLDEHAWPMPASFGSNLGAWQAAQKTLFAYMPMRIPPLC
jgi:hypothetical protein